MSSDSAAPPPALVEALVRAPTLISAVEWHAEATSTNSLAIDAAAAGAAHGHLILAGRQTAGRGRRGRRWHDAPGVSLLLSIVLRPNAAPHRLQMLPLVAGVALAEAVRPFCPLAAVGLKWPNDLLIDGRKAAGILAEGAVDGAVVVGVGVNVDWRGVERDEELAGATSVAEASEGPVDAWKVLAGFAGVFGRRYEDWEADPAQFLDDYRDWCVTLGKPVRVGLAGAAAGAGLEGVAIGIAEDGALLVRSGIETVAVSAGDVEHVRPA
ncbi:MAG TPA: biotin--[acetyl-CoA-carboxylase] ligase [Egibacteraceae bacterium]|nr:biotin--[acetyl-CoA-carboxylase] ligase [Egibacteraceae bacterium]